MEGPAPLMQTPSAPAANALDLTRSYPGIIGFLACSTALSAMPLPISLMSFFAKPETIRLAFATFATKVSSETDPGKRDLAYSVFLLGRLTTGVATQIARPVGGSNLTALGLSPAAPLTTTNPPRMEAATLS